MGAWTTSGRGGPSYEDQGIVHPCESCCVAGRKKGVQSVPAYPSAMVGRRGDIPFDKRYTNKRRSTRSSMKGSPNAARIVRASEAGNGSCVRAPSDQVADEFVCRLLILKILPLHKIVDERISRNRTAKLNGLGEQGYPRTFSCVAAKGACQRSLTRSIASPSMVQRFHKVHPPGLRQISFLLDVKNKLSFSCRLHKCPGYGPPLRLNAPALRQRQFAQILTERHNRDGFFGLGYISQIHDNSSLLLSQTHEDH